MPLKPAIFGPARWRLAMQSNESCELLLRLRFHWITMGPVPLIFGQLTRWPVIVVLVHLSDSARFIRPFTVTTGICFIPSMYIETINLLILLPFVSFAFCIGQAGSLLGWSDRSADRLPPIVRLYQQVSPTFWSGPCGERRERGEVTGKPLL
jgi:hypothetical protein